MKFFISLIALVVLTGCNTIPTSDINALNTQSSNFNNSVTWKASCGSRYKHRDGTFIFTVEKDSIGGCSSDKKAQKFYTHSERSEVKSDRIFGGKNLKPGTYTWSADIEIQRDCDEPAVRNTLFQLHDGRSSGAPPSWFGINDQGNFRTNQRKYMYGPVPKSNKFNLVSEIEYKDTGQVLVTYVVDGKAIAKTNGYKKTSELYMKFGVYRVVSNCKIVQKYANVEFRKIK